MAALKGSLSEKPYLGKGVVRLGGKSRQKKLLLGVRERRNVRNVGKIGGVKAIKQRVNMRFVDREIRAKSIRTAKLDEFHRRSSKKVRDEASGILRGGQRLPANTSFNICGRIISFRRGVMLLYNKSVYLIAHGTKGLMAVVMFAYE